MKKLRSIFITNLIGLVVLFLCLFGYQEIPDLFSSRFIVSHRDIQIDTAQLKNRLSICSTWQLQAMLTAGNEIKEWNRLLSKTKSHIVAEVLKGQGVFWEMDHYPLQDAFDRDTHAQYYYHAHRASEHGHFHLFLRQGGMPDDVLPLLYDKRNQSQSDATTFAHLVAISMDDEGHPIELFTTNRWVTGEDWYVAADVKRMIERFNIEHTHPSYVVNRWLHAMLILFHPQIIDLIEKRDETLMQCREGESMSIVLEDHSLDVIAEESISIEAQLNVVKKILKERGDDISPQ